MTTSLSVVKGFGYSQTKTKFCSRHPFKGLGALGMWYSYCLQSEIDRWETDSRTARLSASSTDKAAFTVHPHGYNIRRVLTDGKLLKVYNANGQLAEDTLLPISLLGANIRILELPEVVAFLKAHGGFYCRFSTGGITHTGYLLEGHRHYSAAWNDAQRGIFFSTHRDKSNARILERLSEPKIKSEPVIDSIVTTRNPAWVRDELILALDLYIRGGRQQLAAKHPDVQELSTLLNRLPIHALGARGVDFRNPTGVHMELGNFRSIDPKYKGAGLARGNHLQLEIWNEFADDTVRLAKIAAAIRRQAALTTIHERPPGFTPDGTEEEFAEGKLLTRLHLSR